MLGTFQQGPHMVVKEDRIPVVPAMFSELVNPARHIEMVSVVVLCGWMVIWTESIRPEKS